jgi:WD40 repeat protein
MGCPDGPVPAHSGRTPTRILCVAFDPRGGIIASGSYDNTIKLWNTATGELLLSLKHDSAITAVTFDSDGRIVVSGGNDGTIGRDRMEGMVECRIMISIGDTIVRGILRREL